MWIAKGNTSNNKGGIDPAANNSVITDRGSMTAPTLAVMTGIGQCRQPVLTGGTMADANFITNTTHLPSAPTTTTDKTDPWRGWSSEMHGSAKFTLFCDWCDGCRASVSLSASGGHFACLPSSAAVSIEQTPSPKDDHWSARTRLADCKWHSMEKATSASSCIPRPLCCEPFPLLYPTVAPPVTPKMVPHHNITTLNTRSNTICRCKSLLPEYHTFHISPTPFQTALSSTCKLVVNCATLVRRFTLTVTTPSIASPRSTFSQHRDHRTSRHNCATVLSSCSCPKRVTSLEDFRPNWCQEKESLRVTSMIAQYSLVPLDKPDVTISAKAAIPSPWPSPLPVDTLTGCQTSSIKQRQWSSWPTTVPAFAMWKSSASMLRVLLCLVTMFSILSSHRVLSDKNRYYHISTLCFRDQPHPLYMKIDGAVVTSASESNIDCTITFQTDTILQKFMLRFEKLALDCNDHLYIYDGAHTIGNYKARLSCRSTRAEVGTIYTQGNFLTLHYTTDAYSKADNGFRLVITAYKDSKNYCRAHRCANQFCISRDLICDGENHCEDNSDETYFANCQENKEEETIVGFEPAMFIAIVASVFVCCLACVISVSFCLCRREKLLQRQQQRIALQQQFQAHQLHDTGQHAGTTPILSHNSYNGKLDGCTMITSLDYGSTQRNGGLVNSFTHTTLPNNFATMPHLHHHNHHLPGSHSQHGSPHQLNSVQQATASGTTVSGQQQQPAHVRFGTLPVRGNEKPPPPYPGNYHQLNHVQATATVGNATTTAVVAAVPTNANGQPVNGGLVPVPMAMANTVPVVAGNGGITFNQLAATPPHSSQQGSQQPVQTQVIYTAK